MIKSPEPGIDEPRSVILVSWRLWAVYDIMVCATSYLRSLCRGEKVRRALLVCVKILCTYVLILTSYLWAR